MIAAQLFGQQQLLLDARQQRQEKLLAVRRENELFVLVSRQVSEDARELSDHCWVQVDLWLFDEDGLGFLPVNLREHVDDLVHAKAIAQARDGADRHALLSPELSSVGQGGVRSRRCSRAWQRASTSTSVELGREAPSANGLALGYGGARCEREARCSLKTGAPAARGVRGGVEEQRVLRTPPCPTQVGSGARRAAARAVTASASGSPARSRRRRQSACPRRTGAP